MDSRIHIFSISSRRCLPHRLSPLTVLALLFQLSEDGLTTALLTAFAKNLAAARVPRTRTTTGALDFRTIAAAGVTWLVLSKRLPLDVATCNRLKTVLKFNARYSQNALGEPNLLVVASEGASTRKLAMRKLISVAVMVI
ncbi:hypothetical protein FB451DRAFT_1515677 [Mycena latifolia]|nr:hypothetical protein FB451DRAFT_1515677 [Mycena latifolia]